MLKSSVLYEVGDGKHGGKKNNTSDEVQYLVHELHQPHVCGHFLLIGDGPWDDQGHDVQVAMMWILEF